jgi:hypothetical protein
MTSCTLSMSSFYLPKHPLAWVRLAMLLLVSL